MSRQRLLKTVALCFVEAVRVTLEHLGARRLELNEDSSRLVADMSRIYADVRRLRDHLQNNVNGFGETIEVDLTPEDTAVLVACCRRAFDHIESRLADESLRQEERRTLKEKQQVVGRWAIELAAAPLLELPLRRLTIAATETSRAFHAKLHAKVKAPMLPREAQPLAGPAAGAGSAPSLGQGPVAVAPVDPDAVHLQSLGGNPVAMRPASVDVAPPPPSPPPPSPREQPPPASRPAVAPPSRAVAPLLDVSRLLDPRLRALVTFDAQSYSNAVAANDLRVATIMLASILEAALVDYVMPRRNEFEINGDPLGWDMHVLVLTILGEQAQAVDRALVRHLFASRNMLRPSMQYLSPTIVTPNSFQTLRKFTQRCLYMLGYGAPAE